MHLVKGGFPRAGGCCNSVCRCCEPASAMSWFSRLFIKVLRLEVWCRNWENSSTLFTLCPVSGGLGDTPHRCMAFSVMWAQCTFSVRLAVWIRGALIKVLWICAAGLFWSTAKSLAWREHRSIAWYSLVGKRPQSVFRAVRRIEPALSYELL